jgi:hypothetical protein
MTPQTAQKIGERFNGTKLVVLDEISMINMESLAEMSDRHIQAKLTTTTDEAERDRISSRPFGGTHMLFTGDLWQLKAIGGTALFCIDIINPLAIRGQQIWHSLNEFTELTENMRFKNDTSGVLQKFLATKYHVIKNKIKNIIYKTQFYFIFFKISHEKKS